MRKREPEGVTEKERVRQKFVMPYDLALEGCYAVSFPSHFLRSKSLGSAHGHGEKN